MYSNRELKIDEAYDEAIRTNKKILVSFVHKVNNIAPLSFFSYGEKEYKGKRYFWKHAIEKEWIVGLGTVYTIQKEEDIDRFQEAKNEWKSILKNSYIFNSFQRINGVGPVLLGGISFLPMKRQNNEWENFHDIHFYLPELMLTVTEDDSYLTENYLLDPNLQKPKLQDVSQIINKIETINPQKNTELTVVSTNEKYPNDWIRNVNKAIDMLKKKELNKIVLAREVEIEFNDELSHECIIQRLMNDQQSSYIFAIESGEDCYLGASPERLIRKVDQTISSVCLAGSTPRGKTEDEDKLLGEDLLKDQKNLDEHQFVVDMIYDSLKKVTKEVTVPDRPVLIKMRDIQHLYTPVKGKIEKDTTIFDIIKQLHPTPALGGTPKEKALELIPQLEFFERGFYAAPLGWVDYKGDGEFIVAIRSGLIKAKKALLFAGCGIVENSNAEHEFEETVVKLRPMLRALGGIIA
jgi:menaquinone-specific isochorismate synthase